MPLKLPRPLLLFISLLSASAVTAAENLVETPTSRALWDGNPPVEAKEGGQETVKDNRVYNVREPVLISYRLPNADEKRPAVIIFPGGGYHHLAVKKEGEAAARWANSLGMHAFIVKYRLYQFGAPAPVMDAQQAIRLVRAHAKDWQINATAVGVVGFSAGGHVAASLSQHYDHDFFRDLQLDSTQFTALGSVSARPDFALLVYPVITMDESATHLGSRRALLGENPDQQTLDFYSLEKQVDGKSPPTFIVHSSADPAVPIDNSVRYWQAMLAHHVPTEFIAYQFGAHGFGLEPVNHHTAQWPDRAADWLKSNGFLEF